MRKRIVVFLLGGTITMLDKGSGGILPALDADALLAGVPKIRDIADIEAISMFGLPGSALQLSQLLTLAEALHLKFAQGFDGAVVVQGTDTIEDTAFVLDLLISGDRPVVVTGAMRAADAVSADGPANLLAAVRVATLTTPALGVVAVLNDEIHAARFVQKTHTSALSAFQSPGAGALGYVVEERVHVLLRPRRTPAVSMPKPTVFSDVALVPLGLGDDGRLLPTLAGLGYRGAVIEGMGAGHVPVACVQPIAALTQQMPVVLATRVRSGRTFRSTYAFAGGEIDMLARGLLPAGDLTSSKSRLLLALLLTAGYDRPAIESAFNLRESVA